LREGKGERKGDKEDGEGRSLSYRIHLSKTRKMSHIPLSSVENRVFYLNYPEPCTSTFLYENSKLPL